MAERRTEFSDRVSNVFGSLNASLKTFDTCSKSQDTEDQFSGQHSPPDAGRRASKSRDRSPHDHDRYSHGRRERPHSQSWSSRNRRARLVPDHVKNPGKWTKYDLEDDGTQKPEFKGLNAHQINQRAALEFLQRNNDGSNTPQTEEIACNTGTSDTDQPQFVFKRPKKDNHSQYMQTAKGQEHQRSTLGNKFGAVTMPEYVVGSKREKKLRQSSFDNKKNVSLKSTSVTLSHLDDDDDEEEEEEEEANI